MARLVRKLSAVTLTIPRFLSVGSRKPERDKHQEVECDAGACAQIAALDIPEGFKIYFVEEQRISARYCKLKRHQCHANYHAEVDVKEREPYPVAPFAPSQPCPVDDGVERCEQGEVEDCVEHDRSFLI